MLSACSSKFVYKNFDWLVHWFVDDYVELNSAQKQQFDEYIEQWTIWHRQNELPKYQAQLEELAADISNNDVSIDRMRYHQDKARAHWVRLRQHISSDIVEMAVSLDDEQVSDIFAALEKENLKDEEKYYERLEQSEKRQKRKWIKRTEDNLENWLGRLTEEQEAFVENSFGRFQSNALNWIAYKRDYQQALRKTFALPTRDDTFKTQLLTLVVAPEPYRNEALLAVSDFNERESQLFLLSLFSLSTDKQRQHLLKEISELTDDIIELQQ